MAKADFLVFSLLGRQSYIFYPTLPKNLRYFFRLLPIFFFLNFTQPEYYLNPNPSTNFFI